MEKGNYIPEEVKEIIEEIIVGCFEVIISAIFKKYNN